MLNPATALKLHADGSLASATALDHAIVHDVDRGLMWDANDSCVDDVDSDETSAAACSALTLGGFTDWREPTADELETIRDRTRFNPACDTSFFPTCKSRFYRTSSPDAEAPTDDVWFVYFANGSCDIPYRGDHARVRAVRSVVPASQ